MSRVRAALAWLDIGHYHHRRTEAANQLSDLDLEVLEISAKSGYDEFASGVPSHKAYSLTRLEFDPLSRPADRAIRLDRALRACNPNVVFVPGWSFGVSLTAIEWCAENGAACVLMSDSTAEDRTRIWWKETIKRRVVALTQAGFVAGRRQVDYLARLGMPEDHIATGYDVVDNRHFVSGALSARKTPLEERERLQLSRHYFLSCSRFTDVKNLDRLIDAFKIYRNGSSVEEGEAWQLVIVGDGELRTEVERKIVELGLNQFVKLTGYKTYDELPIYYGLADAFVLASTSEPWGLVVNEAMAAGLPVLVSERCGCAPDLVLEGRNGFTFNPYNVENLAALMTRIASDDCPRLAMGAVSREIIAHWDLPRFVSGLDAAAKMALDVPRKPLPAVDRMLLRRLAAR